MEVHSNLSQNLRRVTRERGWTQKDVAEQMHLAYTTVNAWYRGTNAPRASKLEKLAKILGVSINDLLADYNSTIPTNNDYNFKQSQAPRHVNVLDHDENHDVSVVVSKTPNYDADNHDKKQEEAILGKSKEFWEIMNLVDRMDQAKQQQVLDLINVVNKR